MRTFIVICLLSVLTFGQELPDTPQPQPKAAAKCGPWSCWSYPDVPNKEVLKSKSLWIATATDVGVTVLDNQYTLWGEKNTTCVEKNVSPPYPTAWELYRVSLIENAVVFGGTYLWLKLKGPKWVIPGFLAYPVTVHIKDSVEWSQCQRR